MSRVTGTMPDREGVKQGAKQAVGVAQQNPLGLAIGSAAFGFLIGMLVPSTRIEDERLGEVADQVKERAKETGQEALDRGKQVAQQAADTAKESGQEQGQELASSLKESARDVASTPGSTS